MSSEKLMGLMGLIERGREILRVEREIAEKRRREAQAAEDAFLQQIMEFVRKTLGLEDAEVWDALQPRFVSGDEEHWDHNLITPDSFARWVALVAEQEKQETQNVF